MIYEEIADAVVASPGSPPGMTASKSSKSSSFKSIHSDDGSVLADVAHFEEIGLDDDTVHFDSQRHLHDSQLKSVPSPYSPSYSSDLRAVRQTSKDGPKVTTREIKAAIPRSRPPYPSLQTHVRNVNVRSPGSGLVPGQQTKLTPFRSFASRSSGTLPFALRHRSPSPNTSLTPRDPNLLMKPRRSSWQSNRDRKSVHELEKECDEDDGDDIPEGLVLDNVPVSPRPPNERPKSRTSSLSPSPDRQPKDRAKSVGNGTPPIAAAHGSLRSPTWRADNVIHGSRTASGFPPPSPMKTRVKSWNAAVSDLSAEVKALTEKLEEHADETEDKLGQNTSGRAMERPESRPRVKSALAELPPVQRTNIMIDPLPVSKEKEAVLSRTRPSWLPPKDPAEERRHLREYQKMMEQSLEADRKREATQKSKSACRDTAADSLMHLWEDDVIPRWNDAIRERRTRELWWHGVAPRSRGVVWSRAIGNELGLSDASYKAALGRARDVEARVHAVDASTDDLCYASWFSAIRVDVAERSWCDLKIFQMGGPLHQSLVDVLCAYTMYRSDIGYVTGCNVSLGQSDLFGSHPWLTQPARQLLPCCCSTFPTPQPPSLPLPMSSTDLYLSASLQTMQAQSLRHTTSLSRHSNISRHPYTSISCALRMATQTCIFATYSRPYLPAI